ncbi:MAG TPA: SPOR domain-containing protein [Rhodanobacter sp.]|nr:SPOR domain-containing protein [Rhodanobacter sp.]
MKTRLLGAAVLIALAVLFVPMFFSGKPPAAGDQSVNLAIPQAPDRELQTKTMSLNPDAPISAPATTAAQPPVPAAPGASSDQLATVDIGSRRPRDVETDPLAGKPPAPTTVTTGSGASPTQPVIPMQGAAASSPLAASKLPAPAPTTAAPTAAAPTVAKIAPKVESTKPVTAAPAPAAAPTPVAAAHGSYTLNLSAYASAANAAALQHRVQALGYSASSHQISQAGKPLTQVSAGPFATRTAAEAARLKIAQAVPGVQPRVEGQDPNREVATAPASHATPAVASASVATKAGGWAVQLAALGSQTDANALRDKLRAAGFDGYVSPVQSGGRQLWQVRAGPQTQRADAQRVHDQIKAKLGIDGVVRQVP